MDRAMVCREVWPTETVERICLRPLCVGVQGESGVMEDIIITCPVCITNRRIAVLVEATVLRDAVASNNEPVASPRIRRASNDVGV
jgi:hypothetical protein